MTYVFAFIGIIAIAYLLWRAFGPAAGSPGSGGQSGRGGNPVGPDDDPDFLRDLDRRKHD
ncbi:hypothetical protein GII30_04030 [Gordonia amarae]|uniref:Uncharacterized protein n=2 Tax=Gordonia amarae TaxID=36821 RepID=G7GR20_9ACTN|nr:hypothetical protein [Gordonia amarae]MCS3877535.1 hypothetical protein [Gordonia amarae]QHN16263.1 hypothetical protein GII35_04035 [Gordonia amarae]QHN20832.1 hypothetical protein GII34_04035 [Gordonia amarae]QHN29683.1 hypothetical protein GII32_04040 [Gordonia amarae]QHN38459.1 hypothetical protein GII30_04030 [Gordonia amarae]